MSVLDTARPDLVSSLLKDSSRHTFLGLGLVCSGNVMQASNWTVFCP